MGRTNTDHPEEAFDELFQEDFVLAACQVGHHQLAHLDVSPYQRALLSRGVDHRHHRQHPDRQMEQGMGYAGAVGMMLMDEMAGVCERVSGNVVLG